MNVLQNAHIEKRVRFKIPKKKKRRWISSKSREIINAIVEKTIQADVEFPFDTKREQKKIRKSVTHFVTKKVLDKRTKQRTKTKSREPIEKVVDRMLSEKKEFKDFSRVEKEEFREECIQEIIINSVRKKGGKKKGVASRTRSKTG